MTEDRHSRLQGVIPELGRTAWEPASRSTP